MTFSKSRSRVLAAWMSASLGVVTARPALAQSSTDAASAQAMFDQARQLMAAGNYGAACPKLEESQRLDPGSGTLLNLGDCYEHDGKLATAWSKFLEAASAAHVSGNAEREATARSRAAALAPKLSKIVIEVPSANTVKGLEVKRDGIGVGAAQWGSAMPADDGPHTVTATAPGRKAWETTVTVARGQGLLNVPIPALEIDPDASKTAASGGSGSGSPARDSSSGLGTQKTVALVAGGIGVVGIGVGTVFGLQSKSKHDEAATHCSGSECADQTGVDLKNDARSAGDLATVGFVIGAAGLVGGAVLWFTAGSGSSEGAASTRVGLGPGRITVWQAW
jgi:hypothetical protein